MKFIKKEALPIIAMLVFMGAYIGSAHAAQYFYYQSLEGLVLSEETYPFYADINGNPYLDIDIYTPESVVYDVTEDSVDVIIDLSDSILDAASISLSFGSSDTNLIETPSNSETGDIRTLTIEKGSSTAWQDVTLTITASHPDTDNVYMTSDIVFSSNCSTPINSNLAAVKKAADISTDYIIACDTNGNYLIETARDLLHITNYQDDTNIGANILSGDYKLLSNIDFDISWSIDKDYQNEAGEDSETKTITHPYIKSVTVSNINNGVDWDLDGETDPDTTEGWIPLGNTVGYFTGTFDGNQKTISNLYINHDYSLSPVPYLGFFGIPENAIIKDIGIDDFYVSGYRDSGTIYIGGLIGYLLRSELTNSYTKNGIVFVQDNAIGRNGAGGLAGAATGGYTNRARLSVSNCYAKNVDVIARSINNASFSRAAGLIGFLNWCNVGTEAGVHRSYATGDVYSEGGNSQLNNAGGLIGHNEGSSYMYDTYSTGDVMLKGRSDGVGALIANLYGELKNSYTTGKVFSTYGTTNFGALNGKGYNANNSYALNDNLRASYAYTSTSSKCSDSFDDSTVSGGCNPLNMQQSWSSSVWNLDGVNLEPSLKNMPSF